MNALAFGKEIGGSLGLGYRVSSVVEVELLSVFAEEEYNILLKTGSLDNAIREFSLARPSWYMSHYTMIYKNGARTRDFLGLFVFIVV